jgi:aminoglycoside phosphotransferase (APT) family kinase protein
VKVRLPPTISFQTSQLTSPGIILHEISGRKVARYGKIVVKSGRHLKLSEADAMKYIATHTTIPVPHVYEAVSDGKLTSITMDFIEGDRLDKVWNSLPEATKLSLAAQVNSMLVQLRSLRGRYIGAVNNDKAIDSRRYDLEGGPFETEAQFNEFLLSDAYPQVPKCFLKMAERSLLTNHAIVFTHGDLAPRNILVREGKVVAVLDWENAGWYPEYWEFVKTFNALDQRCNWYDYVDKIFPVRYEQEFMNDRFVGTLIRHGHS